MMKAEVSGNTLEFSFSPREASMLGISVAMVVALLVLAGWQIAFVALGLSLAGAGAVDAVERSEAEILTR